MKLELKKKDDDGSTFYRYRKDDYLIWFSQYDNGNIYRVNIQGNDGIEYFAVEDETYYPKEFYYTVPRTTISSMKEFDEFNKKVQSAEELRCFLRRFFAESEHGKLYFNKHNKEKEENDLGR